jgi:hypothetical protein
MPVCRFGSAASMDGWMDASWKLCGNLAERNQAQAGGCEQSSDSATVLPSNAWKIDRVRAQTVDVDSCVVPVCRGSEHAFGDPRNPEGQCRFGMLVALESHSLGLLRLVLGDRQKSLLGAARHPATGA